MRPLPLVTFATLAIAIAIAACASPTTPHWSDDGVHVVDGYSILAEQPCDLASADPCVAAVPIAAKALGVEASTIVAAATAGLPHTWMQANGQQANVLEARSGLPAEFIVLTLSNGLRRVIGYGCAGVPNQNGSRTCPAFPLEQYRAGHAPID